MQLKIACSLILLLNFAHFSFSEPYEWDSHNAINNVRIFAQLIDGLFIEYKETAKFMDSIFHDAPYPVDGYSDEQKRTVFNFTFVKWAAEFAHFHVIDNNENNSTASCPNWKVNARRVTDNNPFVHYDQSLGHKIVAKFNCLIFAKEKRIDKTVVDQILQLVFSFAARVLLCSIYDEKIIHYYKIANWQLKTILLAYKKHLTSQNGNENNETHGIFPFKLIEIDNEKNHWWSQSLSPKEKDWSAYDMDQQNFIANFQFILKLSYEKLSFVEIRKILDTIMNKIDKKNAPPLYELMEAKFKSLLKTSSKSQRIIDSDSKFLKCTFISFGRELSKHLNNSSEFDEYEKNNKEDCGNDVHIAFTNKLIGLNNTPAEGSLQLEMDLFNEPLWNYSRVIEYEVNCKEVVRINDALQEKISSVFKFPSPNKDLIDNLDKSDEFRVLLEIVNEFEMHPGYHSAALRKFSSRYSESSFEDKIDSVDKLLSILDQIRADYSISANECELIYSEQNEYPNFYRIFYKIIYEILKKYSFGVNYDQRQQLLTFPLSTGKHIIQRLIEFVERNVSWESYISYEFDFANTLETVASTEIVQKVQEMRKNTYTEVYAELFAQFFTFALRLCVQIGIGEEDDMDFKRCQHTIGFAIEKCDRFEYYFFFEYKINVDNENGKIEINMPNWNLPYFVYLEKENELKVEKATENFKFLCKLSFEYYPTLYEVLKMAKIFHQMPDNDHVLVNSSDPEMFLRVYYLLNEKNPLVSNETKDFMFDYFYRKNNFVGPIKVPINGHFCILALFVKDLLAKAKTAEHLPTIEYVTKFENQTTEVCTDERLKKEYMKNFGEILPNLSKIIKFKLDLDDEIKTIILPYLIAELEKMLKNGNWNFTNLSDAKIVEWKMLEFALQKRGQNEKWTEIQNLLEEYEKKYGKMSQENKLSNFIKNVEEIKEKLEKLKEMQRIVPSGEYTIILAIGPYDGQNQFKFATDKNGNFNWNFLKDIHNDKFLEENHINTKSKKEITILVKKEHSKCILDSYKNYAELKKEMKKTNGKLHKNNSINFDELKEAPQLIQILFNPLDIDDMQQLCNERQYTFVRPTYAIGAKKWFYTYRFGPGQLVKTVADGNCFYRALSILLTGEDSYECAKRIRHDLMQFLKNEVKLDNDGIEGHSWWQLFHPLIPHDKSKKSEVIGIMAHIETHINPAFNAANEDDWATNIDFLSAAKFFKLNLIMCSPNIEGKQKEQKYIWQIYSPLATDSLLIGQDSDAKSVFIYYNGRNHYEAIVDPSELV